MQKKLLFSSLYYRAEIGEKIAIASNDVTYTYDELKCAVELCASDLFNKGVTAQSRVAISAYDEIQTLIVLFAVERLGAVAVMINNNINAKYLLPLLKFADVNFLAYGVNKDTIEDPRAWEILATTLGIDACTYNFMEMDYKGRIIKGEIPDILPDEDANEKREAIVMFTTGTTAQPKAVVHSQASFMVAAESFRARFCPYAGESVTVALPLFHCFGLTATFAIMLEGLYVCYPSSLQIPVIMDLLNKYKSTIMASVGVVYLGLLQSEDFKNNAYPYLETCIVGGAFTSPEHIIGFSELYPKIKFVIGYGMTETAASITLSEPTEPLEKRAYTVGKALDGIEILISKIGKKKQSTKTVGEICVKGDNLMCGYYKTNSSQQHIDKDGWLHTGDLGCIDEDGYLHLTGRIKELIIKNGENVSPIEIQRALMKNVAIKVAHVLGVPDKTGNESICACVVIKKGYSFDEQEIKNQLKSFLNSFKIPDYFLEYKELPTNSVGKVDNASIIKRFVNVRDGV